MNFYNDYFDLPNNVLNTKLGAETMTVAVTVTEPEPSYTDTSQPKFEIDEYTFDRCYEYEWSYLIELIDYLVTENIVHPIIGNVACVILGNKNLTLPRLKEAFNRYGLVGYLKVPGAIGYYPIESLLFNKYIKKHNPLLKFVIQLGGLDFRYRTQINRCNIFHQYFSECVLDSWVLLQMLQSRQIRDINSYDPTYKTPIYYLCQNMKVSLDMIKLAAEYGACTFIKTGKGTRRSSVLEYYSRCDHIKPDILDYLITDSIKNDNIYDTDIRGYSAMSYLTDNTAINMASLVVINKHEISLNTPYMFTVPDNKQLYIGDFTQFQYDAPPFLNLIFKSHLSREMFNYALNFNNKIKEVYVLSGPHFTRKGHITVLEFLLHMVNLQPWLLGDYLDWSLVCTGNSGFLEIHGHPATTWHGGVLSSHVVGGIMKLDIPYIEFLSVYLYEADPQAMSFNGATRLDYLFYNLFTNNANPIHLLRIMNKHGFHLDGSDANMPNISYYFKEYLTHSNLGDLLFFKKFKKIGGYVFKVHFKSIVNNSKINLSKLKIFVETYIHPKKILLSRHTLTQMFEQNTLTVDILLYLLEFIKVAPGKGLLVAVENLDIQSVFFERIYRLIKGKGTFKIHVLMKLMKTLKNHTLKNPNLSTKTLRYLLVTTKHPNLKKLSENKALTSEFLEIYFTKKKKQLGDRYHQKKIPKAFFVLCARADKTPGLCRLFIELLVKYTSIHLLYSGRPTKRLEYSHSGLFLGGLYQLIIRTNINWAAMSELLSVEFNWDFFQFHIYKKYGNIPMISRPTSDKSKLFLSQLLILVARFKGYDSFNRCRYQLYCKSASWPRIPDTFYRVTSGAESFKNYPQYDPLVSKSKFHSLYKHHIGVNESIGNIPVHREVVILRSGGMSFEVVKAALETMVNCDEYLDWFYYGFKFESYFESILTNKKNTTQETTIKSDIVRKMTYLCLLEDTEVNIHRDVIFEDQYKTSFADYFKFSDMEGLYDAIVEICHQFSELKIVDILDYYFGYKKVGLPTPRPTKTTTLDHLTTVCNLPSTGLMVSLGKLFSGTDNLHKLIPFDMKITTSGEYGNAELPIHSFVLAAFSKVYRGILSIVESSQNFNMADIPFDESRLSVFIEYLYTGKLDHNIEIGDLEYYSIGQFFLISKKDGWNFLSYVCTKK